MNDLELERDIILEEIEDLNAEIYSEIKAIEKLQAEYDEAKKYEDYED